MSKQTNNTLDPHCIQLEDAQKFIYQWRNDQEQIAEVLKMHAPDLAMSPVVKVHAFTFSYDEIQELMAKIELYNSYKETPVNAIRFYLGIKSPTDGPKPCLIAVAVTGFGSGKGGNDVLDLPIINNIEGSIYDFSYPCPATCAQKGIMPNK